MNRGMAWETARRIWEPKQFHVVGESHVRQRVAGLKRGLDGWIMFDVVSTVGFIF